MSDNSLHIAVVGGAGHVGLPLSLLLATKGFRITVIDKDEAKILALKQRQFPFLEEGGAELLRETTDSNPLFCTEHQQVGQSDAIILTVGTPVDEHLNPDLGAVYKAIDQIRPYLRNGQVIVLRSTLFPGTSEKIYSLFDSSGLKVGVAFCPERIAQGQALKELQEFPQIISGSDPATLEVVRQIFSSFAKEIIQLSMTEAELAKLFTNTWRYIKFAVANQFYMIAQEKGLDFYRIRAAMTQNYKRAVDFPTAGFAAGPCLFKDTMQLAAYYRQNFTLGHAAMLINETLPNFLIEQAKREFKLAGTKVGILGMAYKADNDDSRESLAYKLRQLLQYENTRVMCTDPYIQDPSFYPLETVLDSCKILFIGCPHSIYRNLNLDDWRVVDCWGIAHSRKDTSHARQEKYDLPILQF